MSTLRVESKDDFARDVLKSDTAGVIIPDLDLELTAVSAPHTAPSFCFRESERA